MKPPIPHRKSSLTEPYDLLVIGGGINGVGVARDAAGRGLSVLLCERDDLGNATSSASSKLLHGGLRYLEQFQFRLVRHALSEREVLLEAAPHVVQPLRFVLPHNRSVRPYWMIRFGMFLYDRLAQGSSLPRSRRLQFASMSSENSLQSQYNRGFEYSDCWVDDARLVVLSAVDARNRGATVLTRTSVTNARWIDDHWEIQLADTESGQVSVVHARIIINATGPWSESIARQILKVEPAYRSRLIKGSHIVVPRIVDDEQAFILQSDDKRIVFILPFENNFSLVGTTDVPVSSEVEDVNIDDTETNYLCAVVNQHFRTQINVADIVWSFSGLRPLYDDGANTASKVSRDYVIEEHRSQGGQHLQAMTIWGGKLTGYRLLAEDVVSRLDRVFPNLSEPWTRNSHLPGGDFHPAGIDRFSFMLTQVYDWLPEELAQAYARRYGSLVHSVIGNASSINDIGPELAPGLQAKEVDYLVRNEWARTTDDVLWRRTKIGLRSTNTDRERLKEYLIDAVANLPLDK